MWVRREETTQYGVIQTGIHVDDAEAVVVLMAGKAAAESEVTAVLINRPVGGTHAVAPGFFKHSVEIPTTTFVSHFLISQERVYHFL